jgi:hypothetical protein
VMPALPKQLFFLLLISPFLMIKRIIIYHQK